MSQLQQVLQITAPPFGTGKEVMDTLTGFACGHCYGGGYFHREDADGEWIKEPCPKCLGTGKVKAVVTVHWAPDGEVKHYFRTT